jgi:hypothetical protein
LIFCEAGQRHALLFDDLLVEDRVMNSEGGATKGATVDTELDGRANIGYPGFIERMAQATEQFVNAAEV